MTIQNDLEEIDRDVTSATTLKDIKWYRKRSILNRLQSPHVLFNTSMRAKPFLLSSIMQGKITTLEIPPVTEIRYGSEPKKLLTFRDLSQMFEVAVNCKLGLKNILSNPQSSLKKKTLAEISYENLETSITKIRLTKFYLILQKLKVKPNTTLQQYNQIYEVMKTLQEQLYGVLNPAWATRMMSVGRTFQLASHLVRLNPKLLIIPAFTRILELPASNHSDKDIIGERLEFIETHLYKKIDYIIPQKLKNLAKNNPNYLLSGQVQHDYIEVALKLINQKYGTKWRARLVPASHYSVNQRLKLVKVPSFARSANNFIGLLAHEVGLHVLRTTENSLIHEKYISYEEALAVAVQNIASGAPAISLTKIDSQTLLYCIYAVGGSVQDMIQVAKTMETFKDDLTQYGFERDYLSLDYHLRRTFRAADQVEGTQQGIIDYKDIVYSSGLLDFSRLLEGIHANYKPLAQACKKLIQNSLKAKANFCDPKTVIRLQNLGIINLTTAENLAIKAFFEADMLLTRM